MRLLNHSAAAFTLGALLALRSAIGQLVPDALPTSEAAASNNNSTQALGSVNSEGVLLVDPNGYPTNTNFNYGPTTSFPYSGQQIQPPCSTCQQPYIPPPLPLPITTCPQFTCPACPILYQPQQYVPLPVSTCGGCQQNRCSGGYGQNYGGQYGGGGYGGQYGGYGGQYLSGGYGGYQYPSGFLGSSGGYGNQYGGLYGGGQYGGQYGGGQYGQYGGQYGGYGGQYGGQYGGIY